MSYPNNITLWQGQDWQINLNTEFTYPGYLFVNNCKNMLDFETTSQESTTELGHALALAERALKATLDTTHILTGRYGLHGAQPIHYHVIAVAPWLPPEFNQSTIGQSLAQVTPDDYPVFPDGAALVFYIWRTYCHGKSKEHLKATEISTARLVNWFTPTNNT